MLAKFSTIIGETVDAAGGGLSGVDYDAAATAAATVPRAAFFGDVAKNLTALHGVLAKQLPVDEVQDVCADIVALLGKKLPPLAAAPIADTPEGRDRLEADLRYLEASVAALPSVDASGLRIDAIVAERKAGVSKGEPP